MGNPKSAPMNWKMGCTITMEPSASRIAAQGVRTAHFVLFSVLMRG